MNCMKRLAQAILALAAVSTMTACGGGNDNDATPVTYSVGRTSIEWSDTSRDEICGTQPAGTKRRLQAYVWYPADPAAGAAKAPLLSAAQVAFLAAVQETPAEVLSKLPSNSFQEAPVARRNASYPVLLMSHGGGGGSPQQYASTAEALAAKGYVVLGLSHPYQSIATFYANGDVVTLDPACDPLGAQPEITETSTYADFTENWQYTVQLDAYISADFASAISQLKTLNTGTGPFSRRLELDRVGALGHSFGGSHAFRAAREMPAIVAAANMDGTVFSEEFAQGVGTGKALLTVIAGESTGAAAEAALAAQVAQLQSMGMSLSQATEVANRGVPQSAYSASRPAYLLSIPTAKHMNFSDVGLWNDYGIPADPDSVNMTAAKAILDLQNQVLADFFDKHLRQRSLKLTLPATPLPGAHLDSRE